MSATAQPAAASSARLRGATTESRRPFVLSKGAILVAPAAIFLLACFVVPIGQMIGYSVTAHMDQGVAVPGLTTENYARLFRSNLYWVVLVRTLRIAVITSLICLPIAYPLAYVMARGSAFWSRLVMFTVISPLLVLVVVRAYGWKLILAKQGFLNWLLQNLGIAQSPPALLYTEWAVIIASAHVFLPFLVLPVASAIGKIDVAVEDAARTLGADWRAVFWRVTVPMSLPGLAVGVTLVFSLTAASYVTPQILGGNFAAMLGTLVQQQVLSVNDWPFGAALATVLLVVTLLANLVLLRLFERRFAGWASAGAAR
ncbi:putative spermidine/putrescine transport system permease protein [Bosea lupini]|uniref:Putative spermidine/putrescine transport system permease protein n=1 Tax=Bosea lupini TaxID=1036779 RepID=A0A1H7ZS27_9HYPH|nr:ABC transporter permease [Bosea lupini]SEM60319.1 putative spermidine/putrescine transport system permease protein [Bosea lupini]